MTGDRLALRQVLSSGGSFPVSVAARGGLVYVLNALDGGRLAGYRVLGGRLVPIPGSGRAAGFVPSRAVAEEVVQDTWLAVLRGLDAFEGRSSLKTWLFRILVNQARTTGTKEHRSVPIPDPEPAGFDASGGWAEPPEHWIEAAEGRLEAGNLADRLRTLMDELPARQREVVLLRDVEELTSDEVCSVLSISDGNQRVLLHRGRSRLRQLFEDEFRGAR